MRDVNIFLGVLFLFTGAVVLLVSVPLYRGKVAMNRAYGIRIAKAYESEASWYAVNRYGGRQMMIYAGLVALVGVAAFFLPLQPGGPLFWVVILAPLLALAVPLVAIARFARRLP